MSCFITASCSIVRPRLLKSLMFAPPVVRAEHEHPAEVAWRALVGGGRNALWWQKYSLGTQRQRKQTSLRQQIIVIPYPPKYKTHFNFSTFALFSDIKVPLKRLRFQCAKPPCELSGKEFRWRFFFFSDQNGMRMG